MFHYLFKQRYIKELLEPAKKMLETVPIANEWRGWNYYNENLSSPYGDIYLPVHVVANKICPTNRDLYLSKVLGRRPSRSVPMIAGILYHEIFEKLMDEARTYIDNHRIDHKFDILKYLFRVKKRRIEKLVIEDERVRNAISNRIVRSRDLKKIKNNLRKLWKYEAILLSSQLFYCISDHPAIKKGVLIYEAMPLLIEKKVDGSRLGLSPRLTVDAIPLIGENVVIDVKSGERKLYHELTTTAYALALESIKKEPIDTGCILYINFSGRKSVPLVNCHIHPITNSLRSILIEERNDKMRILEERIDPGFPSECPSECLFYNECLREKTG